MEDVFAIIGYACWCFRCLLPDPAPAAGCGHETAVQKRDLCLLAETNEPTLRKAYERSKESVQRLLFEKVKTTTDAARTVRRNYLVPETGGNMGHFVPQSGQQAAPVEKDLQTMTDRPLSRVHEGPRSLD